MTIPNHLRRLFWGLLTMLSLMASSQAQLTYNDGDLFLAVRATADPGNRASYLVNLGPATQFTAPASTQFSVNLNLVDGHSITEDLVLQFGPDWATRPDVLFSVIGVQKVVSNDFPRNTIFVSAPETTPGVQSEPWPGFSVFNAQNPALKVQAVGTPGYSAGTTANQTQSAASIKGLRQTSLATNSYSHYMPGGEGTTGASAFGAFIGANGIEAGFGAGTAAAVVDLYKIEPGSGPGTFVGAFRLSDAGVLTFSTDISIFEGPAQVKFDKDSYSISEDGGTVAIKINRIGNKKTAFSLNFSSSDGTAVGGTDFTAQTNTVVSFAANEETKTVNVAITDREGFQGPRDFSASVALLSGTAQIVSPSTTAITITETTLPPAVLALSAATYTVSEDTAAGAVIVTVNRTGSTLNAVTAIFNTTDGTALAGTDYNLIQNTLIDIPAGQSSTNVTIPVTNRPNFQGDRTFTVTLSNPTNGATLGTPATATVTIQEVSTNPAGQVAFSDPTYSFGAADAITVTINRTQGTTGAVSVGVALAAGGSLDAADLAFTSPATVNFADGVNSQTLTISLAAGAGPLPGSFNLALVNPSSGGVALGAQTTTTVNVAGVGIPDLILPKLKLTSPKAGKSAATFNVAGTVTDVDFITRVEVRVNGGLVLPATIVQGTGSATFALNGIAAENGKNVVTVQAFDSKNTGSQITKITLTYTNVREALAGAYNGLVVPSGATPPGNNLNNASGMLTMNVTKTGIFSGKVKIGGASLSIGGIVANDGTALFKPAYANFLPLAIKGKTPVTLGNLSLKVVVGKATGGIAGIATIIADHAHFDGKTNVVDSDYWEDNKGKFTVILPAKAQVDLDPDEYPQGDGFANVTVTKQGKVSFVGTLADGTTFSASAPLSGNYEAPIFAQLYSKKGSFAGLVKLDKNQLESDLTAPDCLWLRPAQPTAKQYVAGWPEGVEIDVFGAIYIVPAKVEQTSVVPKLGPVNDTTGNATLVIEDGKLTGTITEDLNISTTNKITNAPITEKTYKISLSSATGKVTGSFTHSDGTKPALKGILYRKNANVGGIYGFFLSTVPRGGPAGESGRFTIFAK